MLLPTRSGASSIGASPLPSSSASAALAAAAAVASLRILSSALTKFSATFTSPLKSSRASSLSAFTKLDSEVENGPITTDFPSASAARTSSTVGSTLNAPHSCLKNRWCAPQ